MTREEATRKVRMTPEYHYDGVYSHTETNIYEVIDQIFDDHEAQLKAKDEKIRKLNDAYANVVCDFESAVIEIERLKAENNELNKSCTLHYNLMTSGERRGVEKGITKARSIVAMLFWEAKRKKRHFEGQGWYEKGIVSGLKLAFEEAHSMLKDNQ